MNQGEVWGLTRRVDSTAQAAVEAAIAEESTASAPLAAAWQATFGRQPDPTAGYREAVLAVETVACPVFLPNDAAPTLGKAISHLNDTLARWTVAGLDDERQPSAATLLAMLRTIWHNHDRHVEQGGRPPEPVPQAEAETVIFLAVTVVQWFQRGLVEKRT